MINKCNNNLYVPPCIFHTIYLLAPKFLLVFQQEGILKLYTELRHDSTTRTLWPNPNDAEDAENMINPLGNKKKFI